MKYPMNNRTWSKEPWSEPDAKVQFVTISRDDYLRAIACVNAMAGKDPAAYVASYNEMLEFVRVSTRGLTKKKNPLLARAEAARNE